jgi:predicted RecA/RadA family phage recombinase
MKNYVSNGKTIPYTPSGDDVASGQAILVGDILGVAVADIADGEEGELALEGVFNVPKKSTDTFDAGQIVFWDAATNGGELTETASTHKPVGVCMAAAGNPSATVPLKLVPLTQDNT